MRTTRSSRPGQPRIPLVKRKPIPNHKGAVIRRKQPFCHLYHALQQNFSRVERGYGWPAFWKSEGFRNRVAFRRDYILEQPASFTVHSKAVGFVLVARDGQEQKYSFGQRITCPEGPVWISIHAGRIDAFPCIYVEGDTVCSDDGWLAEDYAAPAVPAGHSRYYTRPCQDPAEWEYSEKLYLPVRTERVQGGTLYEFETELTAVLWVQCPAEQPMEALTVCCGESREEALDPQHCYYSWHPDAHTGKCPRCAVRFAFIPGPKVKLAAIHQYVDFPVRARFQCDDELLNRIWAVAEHTFRLCSGIFFVDGIKRDKWIWGGDAYQSLFVNRYLLADPDVDQRTLLALRGNDPMSTHINTIVDYSLLWILSVKEHYETYGDLAFLRQVWPKMQSLMQFCEQNLDEHGFLVGREQDWTFIDWADLDKAGPVAAIQMLLAACWEDMQALAEVLKTDSVAYQKRLTALKENIDRFYWDAEKGAYIDSFTSGKRHVTRQTNIFAVLFDVASLEKRDRILRNVISNDEVPPITTPYFNFVQLDMLAGAGQLDTVLQKIRDYWGGMLERGAVTFWEEFDPNITSAAQYDMYGDTFGKSLCHAWAASPIYLLAQHFIGLTLTEPDGDHFVLAPQLSYFDRLDCTLPVGRDGWVHLEWDGNDLKVETNCKHGVLLGAPDNSVYKVRSGA